MNQGEDKSKVEDVDAVVKEIAEAHPQLGEEKVYAIRQVLEQKSVEPVSESESVSDRFAKVATTLGGSAALGLLAAVAVPEFPVVTFIAAASGIIVSRLAARKIDEASSKK